ncbi:gephyrin-like molybdotransferase Glp [Patulibacter americanus]|uniref:molybdopterin molybdotransferase MoeA n=1 Tax=Patulibacter americanus TaxID=588672 RepID=UPI0003B62D5B|nr:gephyrin-like molybdotransferase Glp [Patulibacter americanus]
MTAGPPTPGAPSPGTPAPGTPAPTSAAAAAAASRTPLTPLDDAIRVARRLGEGLRLPGEDVPLLDAVGRTLHADVVAPRALPAFASSAMDGFALRAADLEGASAEAPAELEIVAESRAGEPADRELRPGQTIRIATGGVIPAGADAVVPYEVVEEDGPTARFAAPVAVGAAIRDAGTDLRAGAVIVLAGTRIEPHHLAPLSGSGFVHVPVRRRPRVSVLMTGDEVVRGAGPDAELPPGAVHDVNGVVVPALVRAWGGEVCETIGLPDDREATRAAIAAATGDILVIGGGLSMGPHDHVRPALEALGARQDAFRIALQPGKPTWLGALPAGEGSAAGDRRERVVFGLPGNPASVFVTATLLVRAALDAALGRPPVAPLRGRLTAPTTGLPGRTAARRACVSVYTEGTLAVSILEGQGSHLLGSLGQANALAIVPPEEELQAGTVVDVVPLDPSDGWAHAWGSVHDHPPR